MLIEDIKKPYVMPEMEAMKHEVKKFEKQSDEFVKKLKRQSDDSVKEYTRDEVTTMIEKQNEVMNFLKSML